MAWQTPKTDWAAADGVRNTDFNRIEGNILELYNTALTHTEIQLYVAPSGNDTTGTGTSTLPYRTVTKALSAIPRNLNGGSATINVVAGTYSETPSIKGFTGPLVLSLSGTATITSITVEDCTVIHTGSLLTLTPPANGVGLTLQNGAAWVSSANVTVTAGAKGILVQHGSRLSATGTVTISNTTVNGIEVLGASTAYAYNLTGTNNITAVSSSGGGIVYYGLMSIAGTTRTFTTHGGRIFSGPQMAIPSN